MRTSVKVTLGIGVLLIIGGIFSMGRAGNQFERLDPFSSDELPSLENVTNGSIILNDEDGKGELGVTFWMEGVYSDENKDGVWDHCENINITITQHPETNPDWDGRSDGAFYFETTPSDSEGIDGFDAEGCESKDENRNYDHKERGLIKVGRACLACYSGTMEFESNMSVWVTYDDPILGQLLRGLGQGGLGFVMCGCGLLFLIIAGLIVVLGEEDELTPVVMQQTFVGQQPVIAQQPITQQSSGLVQAATGTQSATQTPPTITVISSDSGGDPPSNT